MSVGRVSHPVDVMVAGLRAQAMRMNVTAGNIANAQTTRTGTGDPYRKKVVTLIADAEALAGPSVEGYGEDTVTPFKRLYDPGHPDAGDDGFVRMPNIDLPVEMMQMVMASRAYQANAVLLKRYQGMVDVTLELIR